MKKVLVLFALLLVFISGCAKNVEEVPVYVEKKPVETSVKPCFSCEEEKVKILCRKQVKTVHYVDQCSGSCRFPVSVRKSSNCDKDGM